MVSVGRFRSGADTARSAPTPDPRRPPTPPDALAPSGAGERYDARAVPQPVEPAVLMRSSSEANRWTAVRQWMRDAGPKRGWIVDANDGIIATAGILQGFAGAGAGDRLLMFTATAATIAGGLSTGGAKWAEEASERESQLRTAYEERSQIDRDRESEIAELTEHWTERGLQPELAGVVAEQLMAHDALAAQLESEHGFDAPMPAVIPILSGLATCLAFVAGALVPLLITYFAPVDIETVAILVAVAVALTLTSIVSARAAHLSAARTLGRSLTVGGLTLLVSYVAGEILLG